MSIQIDRQITREYSSGGKAFFLKNKNVDTVKVFHKGVKSYAHFDGEDVQTFSTKKALRRALSQESGCAWIEEKEGKKRYFVDESGWFNTSYRQVTKEECLQKLETPSTMQKVLGLSLGILALAPGAAEFARHMPFGSKEAAMGLVALNAKSPALGALGCSLISSEVDAQAVGTEFQINNFTTYQQGYPSVAGLSDGGFVVVWDSRPQNGNGFVVYAQKFLADGEAVGGEFRVTTGGSSYFGFPEIATLQNGGFVIVWGSLQEGDSSGIYGRRYDSRGAAIGGEFHVNSFTIDSQRYPGIAVLQNGGFIVVWNSEGQDGDANGVYGQRYDVNGTADGAEFQINNYTVGWQWNPRVAGLQDGGFVATWQSGGDQDGSGPGIFGKRYNVNGTSFEDELQINTYTLSWQEFPDVAATEDGGFIVVWAGDVLDGDVYGVFGQRYHGNSSAVGSEFQINTYTTSFQSHPSVAVLTNGEFVVTWMSSGQDGAGEGVYGQKFSVNGTAIGPEFQVNSYTASDQQFPSVAALQDGGFVVVWMSDGQDGDLNGIYGQRYDANGAAVGSPPSISMNPSPSLELPASTLSISSIGANHSTQTNPTARTETSLPSGFQTPVLIDIIYEESYSVELNGQTIGTFSISGGSGMYSSSNPNTLNITIDPDIVLQDGDTVTLFSVPQGEELQWEGIRFTNEQCFSAEGVFIENQGSQENSYQVVFNLDSDNCSIYAGAPTLGLVGAALIASN